MVEEKSLDIKGRIKELNRNLKNLSHKEEVGIKSENVDLNIEFKNNDEVKGACKLIGLLHSEIKRSSEEMMNWY